MSLKFGKITQVDTLAGKEFEFPQHHFEFISYNQLASRIPYKDGNSKMIYPLLTGCVWSIGEATPFGESNTGESGNVVEFTMWDEVAKKFNKENVEKLAPPVIIAVSSYRVTKYIGLGIKGGHPTLNQLHCHSYGIRFTCEAIITRVEEDRGWNYPSCSQCSKASTQVSGTYTCEDHGKQDPTTYRFVKGFSRLALPLTKHMRKGEKFVWNEEREKSFEELKQRLVSAPVLTHPSGSGGFQIYSDASKKGLGCVLMQHGKVGDRVIEGPEMIEVTNSKVDVAKEKLKEARTR
nr:putative reverse transcriptase domain-containing protein [Tanacetum cinerariifolium]